MSKDLQRARELLLDDKNMDSLREAIELIKRAQVEVFENERA